MLRILVHGDRFVNGTSGYSKINYELCTRFLKMDHQVSHVPVGRVNNMGDQVLDGILVKTSGLDGLAEDVIVDHYNAVKADILVTTKDAWALQRIPMEGLNTVYVCPIDHSPVSGQITSRLHGAFKVVAVSRFAQRELKKAGIESIYIPNGSRTDFFQVLSPEERGKCKKLWYMEPDDFVIGIVARNQVRKQIARMLRVYRKFLDLNPDVKAHLFLWTNIFPESYPDQSYMGVADVGVNLIEEINQLGLAGGKNDIRWMNPRDWQELQRLPGKPTGGIPDWDPNGGWCMCRLFNAFDVYLNTTGGEGFSLTQVESQLSGTPVLTTDYAAGPEQCGVGYAVPASDYAILNTPGTRYALVDIDRAAEALSKIYNADREKLARRARRFAERYDWYEVFHSYWEPFLSECSEELYPKVTKEGWGSWAK